MTLWYPSTAAERPTLTLTKWSVWEMQLPWLGKRTRHLVGWVVEEGSGKVSSTVVTVEPASRQVTTETGRVYTLDGPPGVNGDAQYTLQGFIRLHKAVEPTDVTAEVAAKFAAAN